MLSFCSTFLNSKNVTTATKTKIQKFLDVLEDNTKGVKIGVYSVAIIGLVAAIRRVRPFAKFKRPEDIPKHFLVERRELTGKVQSIEPLNALLMINHKPLVNLPFRTSGILPVKLSGINVTGNGISWLQAIVANSDIKFIPVVKEKNWIQCEVFISQQNKPHLVNVAESLVAIGFGSLQENQKNWLIPRIIEN